MWNEKKKKRIGEIGGRGQGAEKMIEIFFLAKKIELKANKERDEKEVRLGGEIATWTGTEGSEGKEGENRGSVRRDKKE